MIKKVAIIDDDTIFQFTTKVTIERLKLAEEVVFFEDGGAIHSFIQETAIEDLPEILLLDINMPITDGWDFLELYKDVEEAKREKMKVFMLSSSINPVDVNLARDNPFVLEYVTKPISDLVLQRILVHKKTG
jgi:CheY-like chemotaxis protein